MHFLHTPFVTSIQLLVRVQLPHASSNRVVCVCVCMNGALFPLFSLVLLSNPNELMTISVWKRNKFSHFSTLSYKVVCRIHKEHMEIWMEIMKCRGGSAREVDAEKCFRAKRGKAEFFFGQMLMLTRSNRKFDFIEHIVCACAEIFALFARIWHIALPTFLVMVVLQSVWRI